MDDPQEHNSLARKDVDRIRSLIQDENSFQNNRTNWFLLIQGFLFAALAQIITAPALAWLTVVLSLVGIAISITAYIHLLYARNAILKQWDYFQKQYQEKGYDGPLPIGLPPRMAQGSKLVPIASPDLWYPLIFVIAWGYIAARAIA